MAGMCTRTGADLAIGCAAPAGATMLPGAATDGVGAGAASLEQAATTAMMAMTASRAATPASTQERARRGCRFGMR